MMLCVEMLVAGRSARLRRAGGRWFRRGTLCGRLSAAGDRGGAAARGDAVVRRQPAIRLLRRHRRLALSGRTIVAAAGNRPARRGARPRQLRPDLCPRLGAGRSAVDPGAGAFLRFVAQGTAQLPPGSPRTPSCPRASLTFLAPDFFGSDGASPYWGQWNLWEMSAYVGVAAIGLAFVGVVRGERGKVALACSVAAGLPAAGAGRPWAGAETALRARARFRPLSRVGAVPVRDEPFPRAAGRHGRRRDRGGRRRGRARKPPIRAGSRRPCSTPPAESRSALPSGRRAGARPNGPPAERDVVLAALAALLALAGIALWSDIRPVARRGRASCIRPGQVAPPSSRSGIVAATPVRTGGDERGGVSLLRAAAFLGALVFLIQAALRASQSAAQTTAPVRRPLR